MPLDPAQRHKIEQDAVTAASALQQALAALSRQERTVVVLRFFEDLTVPRIADAMGISEGSVKRYLSNATGKLQHRLGPVRSPRDQDDVAILTLSTDRPGRS